jgi:hypothetical protein
MLTCKGCGIPGEGLSIRGQRATNLVSGVSKCNRDVSLVDAKSDMILPGGRMLFESKNTRLQDVPWYVWLFYTTGIVVFFVLLLKQVWWYFGAANVFFLTGSYLLHRIRKRRPRVDE